MSTPGERALVTGATGFLGGAVALRLAREGFAVTGMGRDAAAGRALEERGVAFVAGDIADERSAAAACKDQDYVVHCAALSSAWGRPEDFFRTNVVGTRVIARAGRLSGVRRLIHVSSPSIFADRRPRLGVREDDPPAATPLNDYAATKLLAEKEIDAAHSEGLHVVTIRPQGIVGPGDPSILPRIIRTARRGVLPVIGDGRSVMDLTYIDNVVDSVLQCMRAPESVVGRKYHITNGEPSLIYDVIERVLSELGVRYRRRQLPLPVAYALGGALEAVHRALMLSREPRLTRYTACVLGCSRTLDISAARRDLGYSPRVPLDEGLRRFVAWWKTSEPGAPS